MAHACLLKGGTSRRTLLCLLLALAAAGPVAGQAAPGAPPLWADATLYRDGWGVPHIYAENPRAMAFAFGYAQAEDHIEEMLLAYRVANGRAAEVLGESHAASDAFSLKMGHARLARAALAEADPVTIDLCEGFALGVNAWLAEHAGVVPPWAEGVQPPDVLALWHAFLVRMAPLDLPGVERPPHPYPSANAWALSAGRSESGRAVLVLNPHQRHDGAFRWYEAHLVLPDMDMAGCTLFGLPVIVQGHNKALGWALTPNRPDFADVFEEEVTGPERNPKDPSLPDFAAEQAMLLEYMSQARPYYVRTEGGLDERYVPALIAKRGPVFERAGTLFSWLIGGYRELGGLRQLFEMARCATLGAFQDTLLMRQIPCFHVVYADREGNIFYLYNANAGDRAIPEEAPEELRQRAQMLDWKTPVPASLAGFTWRAAVPAEALPSIVNPESGYVQACGNPPWLATENAPIGPKAAPAWFAADEDTFRAKRVRHMLRAGFRAFRDHHAMLYDTVVPGAIDLAPWLVALAEENQEQVRATHPDMETAIGLLRGWRALAERDSPGMTFFHLWWAMARAAAPPAIGPDRALHEFLLGGTPEARQLALDAAADAARMLRNEYGEIAVPWGEVHRIARGPRYAPIFGAGTGDPLFVASDHVYEDRRWVATYGYGFAMAVQFGEVPEAVSVAPFGASEHPDSPHFDDQLDLLLEKRLKHTRYQRDAVWRYAQRARGLDIMLLPLGVAGAVRLTAPEPVEARLRTSGEPPAALPEDLAAFTLFLAPEWAPAAVPLAAELELHVPETVCAQENLEHLGLYAWREGGTWQPLAQQQMNPGARTFTGFAEYAGGAYVVAGPPGAMLEAPSRAEGETTEAQPDGPRGLDLLEGGRPVARKPAETEAGRKQGVFKFERLDKPGPEESSASDAPDGAGRLFRFERADKPENGEEPETPGSPAPPADLPPGMVFGPATNGASPRERETAPEEGKGIFRIERLDEETPGEEMQEAEPAPQPPPPGLEKLKKLESKGHVVFYGDEEKETQNKEAQ